MENRLAIFVVGFDEKLVIRAGFRIGLQPGDTALLVYSLGGGEFEKSKVSRAVETLRGVFSNAGIEVRELTLDANNFGNDVASIVRVLKELKPKTITISLGSGMRYLGVAALYASLLYKLAEDVEIYIHVAREDGLYDVFLDAENLRLSVGPSELMVICRLRKSEATRDVLVRDLSAELGKSASTIYSLLDRMEERGLIKISNNTPTLSPLGEAVANSLCGE